jgi:hypothetical protein
MPKFVIERQYLLPIYQRLIIDAPDITTACQEAWRMMIGKAPRRTETAQVPRRSMPLERSQKGSSNR